MQFLNLIKAYRKHEQAKLRSQHRVYSATKLQALFRGHKGRKAAMRLKKIKLRKLLNDKAIIMQSVVRTILAKKKFRTMKTHSNRVVNLKLRERSQEILKVS